ncbi:MAG: helix-turn-helix domain-containing protein, partial [Anaerorhabdus sp.]
MKKDNKEIELIAHELYKKGMKYKEIAKQVNVTESCIKSWANRYWKLGKLQPVDGKKVATKCGRGKHPNSRNGTGPPRNQNAV